MASGKSEVMGVRVEPCVKAALQLAGVRTTRCLANLIVVMVGPHSPGAAPLGGASEEGIATLMSRKHP